MMDDDIFNLEGLDGLESPKKKSGDGQTSSVHDDFSLNLGEMLDEGENQEETVSKSSHQSAPLDFGGFPGEEAHEQPDARAREFNEYGQHGSHDGFEDDTGYHSNSHGENRADGIVGDGFVMGQETHHDSNSEHNEHEPWVEPDFGPLEEEGEEGKPYGADSGEHFEQTQYDEEPSVKKKSSLKTMLLTGVAAIACCGAVAALVHKKHEERHASRVHTLVAPSAAPSSVPSAATLPDDSAPSALPDSSSPSASSSGSVMTKTVPAMPSINLQNSSHDTSHGNGITLPPSLDIKPGNVVPTSVKAGSSSAPSEPKPSEAPSAQAPASGGATAAPVPNLAQPVKPVAEDKAAQSGASLPDSLSPVAPLVPSGVSTLDGKAPPLPNSVAEMMGSKSSVPAGATENTETKNVALPLPPPPPPPAPPSEQATSSIAGVSSVAPNEAMSSAASASLEQKTAYMRGLVNLMQNEIITLHTEIGTMQKQQQEMQANIEKNRTSVEQSFAAVNASIADMSKTQDANFTKLEKEMMHRGRSAGSTASVSDENQILSGYRLVAVSKTKDEIERLSDHKHFVIEMGHDVPGGGIAKKTVPYMKASPNGDVQSWELVTTEGRIVP